MKRRIAAAILGIGIICSPAIAQAQVPVTDGGNLIAQAKSLLQQLKSYASELQMIQNQLQQIQWAVNLFQNLVHDPNLGTVMQLANLLGINPDLPINPYALQSLVSGYGGMNSVGGIAGKLGNLSGLIRGSYTNDSIYQCTDNSFACQQQQARAASTAGIKGIAGQVYGDLVNHLQVLQGLRTRLSTASNPKDVADAQAQISIEQTWVNNASAQLQSVGVMADAQRRVSEDQANQKLTNDIDAVLASAPK